MLRGHPRLSDGTDNPAPLPLVVTVGPEPESRRPHCTVPSISSTRIPASPAMAACSSSAAIPCIAPLSTTCCRASARTAWGDLTVTPNDWATAFSAHDTDVDHNTARDPVWKEPLDILTEVVVEAFEEADPDQVRAFIGQDPDLREVPTTA